MTSPSEQQVVRTQHKATRSIGSLLEELNAEELARKTNAQRRQARKCTTSQLLMSFWELCSTGVNSYDNWAAKVGQAIGGTISGMAICKRMSSDMIRFLIELLGSALALAQRSSPLFNADLFQAFKDVLVQDASHFWLPDAMAAYFPGSYSRRGNRATAKVQAVLSLTRGSMVDLQLRCYRDNDQGDASRILSMVKKGTLVIRDLGYFSIDAFNGIADKDAFFLSRFTGNVTVSCNDQKIDLARYLKRHGGMDQEVIIGAKKQLKCRMVAIELPAEQAAQRVRKAKADRNAKANHSKSYYALLKYSIYITNVDGETWSALQVAEAYRCRWFIEIMFKSWKTGLGIDFNVAERYADKLRVEYYLYARLLQVVLLVMPTFRAVTLMARRKGRTISIVKLSQYIQEEIRAFVSAKNLQGLLEKAAYHCVYERRKRRANCIEILMVPSP
jgi:hypothetical protein